MTVEIEAPAAGVLPEVSAQPGDVVPVGKRIALIFAGNEAGLAEPEYAVEAVRRPGAAATPSVAAVKASPLARNEARRHDLVQHPRVNTSWKDAAIVQHGDISVGLAVALDKDVVVPVLHRADTSSLAETVEHREDLVSRAQAGKLRPADIQCDSALGTYGADTFNAIVNPPQVILAVGRVADRVVAASGQAAVQPTMVLTLSCDQRALDGARAAQFLGALAELIEEPLTLLV